MREGLGGPVEHAVGDLGSPANDGPKANSGKDVHVVALRRVVHLAIVLHRVEWRTTCKEELSVGPLHSLLERTLGLGRGVGEREDDRRGAVLLHLPNHLLSKCGTSTTEAEENRRLRDLDRFEEGQAILGVAP